MERFLEQCARYIYQNHESEMQEICLVFPNRRSGVFFTSYLQRLIKKPLIGPQISTINEFFTNLADFQIGDKLQLIALLYSVFKKHTQTTETFDEFYFWGEILLSDFNDIDHYLVNANDLFTNISDLKQLESLFDYLSDEQKKALEYFWGSVAVSDKKEFQKKYINVWAKLFPVYNEVKQILANKKLAYSGMNARLLAEKLSAANFDFPFKHYIFIGLNALNNCEIALFNELKKQEKASFLWDFDTAYLNDPKNEAVKFLRNNLIQFPAPRNFSFQTNLFNSEKEIEILAVSSIYGQSQAIPDFLMKTKPDFLP